jgi:hypothetical protein
VTTAPQENRGGYRPDAGQNNLGVSATGGNGSADGVPNINYTGFAYGQNQAINQAANSGLPMGQQSAIPAGAANINLPEITPITAPSENPDRPITYGMPFGDGAGPEVNPLPVGLAQSQDPSHQIIRAMYQQNPRNEDLRYLVETMDAQAQQMVQ